MAYPGEQENVEYIDYAEEQISMGRKPLSKSEWREDRKKQRSEKTARNEDRTKTRTLLSD